MSEQQANFTRQFLDQCSAVIAKFDVSKFEQAAQRLSDLRRRGGRLFILGSGGGAGHASHSACDFRKLCNIEAYAPYDNVSELTARTNDEGWENTLSGWLKVSRLNERDALFIFSVGGGNQAKNVSMNLVNAMHYAKESGAEIIAVVGRDGGTAAQLADVAILIPNVEPGLVTPLTEGFQAVVWHLLVSHPMLQAAEAKWESLSGKP
jgi:D-sedoheptulose 7-phosphate isomerase